MTFDLPSAPPGAAIALALAIIACVLARAPRTNGRLAAIAATFQTWRGWTASILLCSAVVAALNLTNVYAIGAAVIAGLLGAAVCAAMSARHNP